MTEKEKIAKAGKLLCVDQGEYSNYSVTGFFVVLKNFDPLDELAKHLGMNPEQKERYHFREQSYLAFLLAQGFLIKVEHGNLYLGSYASDDVSFTPTSVD